LGIELFDALEEYVNEMVRSHSSRRALSPVISTLIMINIVIAMFVVLFSGFVPSITLSQSQANYWYGSKEDASRERIAIEMIYFNQTSPNVGENITIWVRNVGEIDVKIIALYVNGTVQNSTSPSLNGGFTGGYPIYVETGSIQYPSVQTFLISYNWEVGETYVVKAVTARGSDAISTAHAQ